MTSMRYQPVQPDTLHIEPDIYPISDDTVNIFGEQPTRIPLALRELVFDPRLNPSHRVFCLGSVITIIAFLFVVFCFIVGGYVHVQKDLEVRKVAAANGLQMIPNVLVDGALRMRIPNDKSPRADIENYVKEIDDFIKKYTDEQESRKKFMDDCSSKDKPEHAWCRFNPTKAFQRSGKGCTKDDSYGFYSRQPCILVLFKDKVDWYPIISPNASQLTFKCYSYSHYSFDHTQKLNFSYYPTNVLNAEYGGFPLNKIPARKINGTDSKEISDENGETLYDLPAMAFFKVGLPEHFTHGSVQCKLVDTLPGAGFPNLNELLGVRELEFDIITE